MIVFDVETTGTNFQKNSIVSIGAVDFLHPDEQFFEECRVWDGAHIDERALAVNGYTEEELLDTNKQSEADLITHFFEWLKNRESILPVAHNPLFDLGFAKEAALRASIEYPFPSRSIDIHSVCFAHMISRGVTPPMHEGKSALDSDAVMKYVGIPTEPKPHIAINGARYEAEVLSRLLYGKNLLSEFADYPLLNVKNT